MGNLKRALLSGAAALAMAGTGTLITTSPAAAASTVDGCTTTIRVNAAGLNEATSLCTQGSGTYRVSVLFAGFSISGDFAPRTGPTVQVGQPSTLTYSPLARVLAASTQILS